MGNVLTTFCFDTNEAKIEKEIRALNLSPSPPKFQKKSKTKLSPGEELKSLSSLNCEMKKHIDSIKDIEEDLFEEKASPISKDPDSDCSFTLIINRKSSEKDSKKSKSEKSSETNSEEAKFEYLGNLPETMVNEEDLKDFLEIKTSLTPMNNNSLVKEERVLSAIKELSERSDISREKRENLKSLQNSTKMKEERDFKEQLKEIEELNLLEVKDSFEMAEGEDFEEEEEEKEGKVWGRKRKFKEDDVRDQRQRKSDFEYFCSSKAKRFMMELQVKMQERDLIKNSNKKIKKAKNMLINKKRKSARKSAQNEIKGILQKIKNSTDTLTKNKENLGVLNDDYVMSDSYKRKSQQLLSSMGKRICDLIPEKSEKYDLLKKEVESFYSEIISKNLNLLSKENL
jgi:hypothetical protein